MSKKIMCPIRLIFGISGETCSGFAVVYENSDGSAGHRKVWFHDEKLMAKILFTNRGESRLVWEVFNGRPEIKSIIIRRDAQIKIPRRRKPAENENQAI